VFSYIVLKLQVKTHVGKGSLGKIPDCAFIPVIQYKCDHLIINQSDGLVKESVNIKCFHIFVFSTYDNASVFNMRYVFLRVWNNLCNSLLPG
jgi:hypothetical protein